MKGSEERNLMNIIDKLTLEKIENDENFLRFTYFEVMVKNEVKANLEDEFIRLAKTKLNNMGYLVYLKDQRFVYKDANMLVQPNELLIAIK